MLAAYQEESGFMPNNESDVMIRMRVLAGEIYKERAYAEYILRQMFPTTAQGTYLEAHAAQRNITRKAAVKAVGSVTFYTDAETHEDILIPGGTQVCTTGDMLRFVTDEDVTLEANDSDVSVGVTAALPGACYNVAPNTVGIIVTPVSGVDRVVNDAQFTGGADEESDEELRARVAESYAHISNGANAAYYRAQAMSVDGVYAASVVGMGRGAGTVDVYVCGQGTALPQEKLQEVQSLLSAARELNVDVQVSSPSFVNINLYIKLTVADGYDFDTVAGAVRTAVTGYINSLGLGAEIRLCKIGEVIYHIDGVAGYKFLESYGSDRDLTAGQYAVANNILVRDS